MHQRVVHVLVAAPLALFVALDDDAALHQFISKKSIVGRDAVVAVPPMLAQQVEADALQLAPRGVGSGQQMQLTLVNLADIVGKRFHGAAASALRLALARSLRSWRLRQ